MPNKFDFANSTVGSIFNDWGNYATIGTSADAFTDKTLDLSKSNTAYLTVEAIPLGMSDKVAETLKKSIAASVTKSVTKLPMPEVIIEREKNGRYYTTVKWSDGTYTSVKASEDDASERSAYMAFCAALAKKLYGSNSAVHRVVDRHMETYIKAEKSKAAAKKRAKEREAEQAAHERALLREAKRLRLKEEAKAYNRAHKMDEE